MFRGVSHSPKMSSIWSLGFILWNRIRITVKTRIRIRRKEAHKFRAMEAHPETVEGHGGAEEADSGALEDL
jgi:hypothetical protein